MRVLIALLATFLLFTSVARALEPTGLWNVEIGLTNNSCGIGTTAKLTTTLLVRLRKDGSLVGIDSLSGVRYKGRRRANGKIVFTKRRDETVGAERCEVLRKISFVQATDLEAALVLSAKLECPGEPRCGIAYAGSALK